MLSDNPTLMVLKDGQVLTKRAPVYFLNEIIVAAFQGQAGVADIKSVTIDNKVVSLTPTNYRGIYYLPVGDDLAVNSDHGLLWWLKTFMEKTLISVPFSLINLLDSLSRIWKKT